MDEKKREVIYEFLTSEFWQFATKLNDYDKVDLDGKLYRLAGYLASGRMESLLQALEQPAPKAG